jgi:cob(I)alamin adenosyltransferase
VKRPKFNQPRLAINRVYTRRGDAGQTSLAGGQRVAKNSLRIEAYGTVDELNCFVGIACQTSRDLTPAYPQLRHLTAMLIRVQHELFNLGSILATRPQEVRPAQPSVSGTDVARLEGEIDRMNERLPELRSFVLPGGCRLNAELHVCRAVCRRAERRCVALAGEEEVPPEAVRYLNRLSDAFFVCGRWASSALGAPETMWDPNQSASGQGSPTS